MTKVTLKDEQATFVAPKKNKFESIQDTLGRTIQLRELDPMQQARLVMGVGPEVAQNGTYMNNFAVPAAMVAHIDDEFFGFPSNIKHIETMLTTLGTEGMEAIGNHLAAKFAARRDELERAALSAEQAAAKN